jgi:hypothetical protein
MTADKKNLENQWCLIETKQHLKTQLDKKQTATIIYFARVTAYCDRDE